MEFDPWNAPEVTSFAVPGGEVDRVPGGHGRSDPMRVTFVAADHSLV